MGVHDIDGTAAAVSDPPVGPSGGAPRIAGAIAVGVTALAVMLLGLRLRYGIDLLDESYYAAVSYRFALGMRPILDDVSGHQFASFLVSPFVRMWLSARGDLTGIILALRVVYAAAALLAGAVAFTFLRKLMDWRISLVAVACSLGLVPYLWFTPSYNTITLIALSVATSLAGIALVQEHTPWLLVSSGVALGLAAVAYPTQALTVAAAIVLIGFLTRSWKVSALVALGAALVAIVLLVALRGTFSGVSDLIAYNRFSTPWAGHLDSGSRLPMLARGIVGATYLAPATYLLAVILVFRVLRRRVPAILTAALPMVVLLAIHVDYGALRTLNAATLILLAVLVSGFGPMESRQRTALIYVFGVGTFSAALFAYTSATGMTAFGVGAAAVSAAGMAVLLNNARDALAEKLGATRALTAAVAIGAVSTMIVLTLVWSFSVREGDGLWRLRQPATGPFAGLLTSPESAAKVAQIEKDLAGAGDAEDGIYVYNAEPAVHLFSAARPVAPYMFIGAEGRSKEQAEFVLDWLRSDGHRPTVVVVKTEIWNARESAPRDYLMEYIDENFTKIAIGREYVVLKAR